MEKEDLEFHDEQQELYQEDKNYLEPLSKRNDILLYFKDYRKELYDNLCITEPESNQITVLTLPSFAPESFLIIEKQGDIFIVKYRIFESSLWGWLAKKHYLNVVTVKEYELEIDKELGNKVFHLFEKEVKNARPPQIGIAHLDGIGYYISMYIGGTLCKVMKHSPDSNSTLATLFNQIAELKSLVSA